VSPDGENVYATNEVSNNISQYSRNTETGKLTTLSPATIPTEVNPSGITISPDGKSIYATNGTSNSLSQYKRNP
jgi:DNA-binding beta-propeller fold protein YncE